MNVNRVTIGALALALTLAIMCGPFAVAVKPGGDKKPRDATLTGRIVDLHSYMTGKFTSSNPVRATRLCIQEGVPAALEVSDGLIVLGQGTKSPRKVLTELAYQEVEVQGRLYERGGLRYIDLSEVKAVKAAEEADDETDDASSDKPESDEPDEDEPPPPDLWACCLAEGECVETDETECGEAGGEFHRGLACDEVECDWQDP